MIFDAKTGNKLPATTLNMLPKSHSSSRKEEYSCAGRLGLLYARGRKFVFRAKFLYHLPPVREIIIFCFINSIVGIWINIV